jgi:hypothetical protein
MTLFFVWTAMALAPVFPLLSWFWPLLLLQIVNGGALQFAWAGSQTLIPMKVRIHLPPAGSLQTFGSSRVCLDRMSARCVARRSAYLRRRERRARARSGLCDIFSAQGWKPGSEHRKGNDAKGTSKLPEAAPARETVYRRRR